MSAVLMVLALLLPLVAQLFAGGRARLAALILAPLPLLVLALQDAGDARAAHLLLGLSFAVDGMNRPLLLLAGLGWMLAGAAASRVARAPVRFSRFWLLVLAGQAWLLLAADLAGFYGGYLMMTLAAFGLVVHAGTAQAWRAGRVYLVLALAGEALVLAGVLLVAGVHGNASLAAIAGDVPGTAGLLLLAGFAVKLGQVPVHVWLPVAHPVAPVPASAVLSGVLVKAGLLGMLRLVPPDAVAPGALLALGLLTALWGALAGLCQRRLKTVLAYSTVSQMGLVMAAFAALQASGPVVLPVLGVLVLHHGLNKVALFLAAGGQVGASRWRGLLFALPALSLAGLPLATGQVAKDGLKSAFAGAGWESVATLALPLSSLLTALLLLHAWSLARADRPAGLGDVRPVHPAWPLAVLAGLAVPWAWAVAHDGAADWSAPALVAGLLPLLLAPAIRGVLARFAPLARTRLPEGDLLGLVEPAGRRLVRLLARGLDAWSALDWRKPAVWPAAATLAAIESRLGRLPVAGGLLLLLVALLAVLTPGG